MALRNADYSICSKRKLANKEDDTGIINKQTGNRFIIIPHWVADKIDLMGGDLSRLLMITRPATTLVSPNVNEDTRKQSPCFFDGEHEFFSFVNSLSDNREIAMLSGEDFGDIGLLNYLIGLALNKVHKETGLLSYSGLKLRQENNQSGFFEADVSGFRMGVVDTSILYNYKRNNNRTTNLVSLNNANSDLVIFDNSLFFEAFSDPSLNELSEAIYKRLGSAIETIPQRVDRREEVVNVYDNQGTITFVLKPDVINTLLMYTFNKNVGFDSSEHHKLKETLVRILEIIIETNLKWCSVRKLGAVGLPLLLAQLL